MNSLIISADDFGASIRINEAVERSHRDGVLTAASLMVGGDALWDAVERARRLPGLRVGLHLAVVNARPASSPQSVPDLVDGAGRFGSDLLRAGIIFFFKPGVRRQLRRELRAQFEAFRKTDLELDHVNFHNHMHLHPTVGRLMLRIGKDYGMKAVRYPHEPLGPYCRASGGTVFREAAPCLFLLPWMAILKTNLLRADLRFNRFVFGLRDSGRMSLERTISFIRNLPRGVTEIYFHPGASYPRMARDEADILTSPELRDEITKSGARLISFGDL